MDSELKDYLDRLERHIDTRFEESQAQLADFRHEVDQRFKHHVDARFKESQAQLADFRHEAGQRFERLDDKVRQTQVVVEDVRGLVQTVAEGVVAVRERQQQGTEELKEEIGEVRDLVTTSYRYLDRRLSVPEGRA